MQLNGLVTAAIKVGAGESPATPPFLMGTAMIKRLLCYFYGHQWDEIYHDATHPYVAITCIRCRKEQNKIRIFND